MFWPPPFCKMERHGASYRRDEVFFGLNRKECGCPPSKGSGAMANMADKQMPEPIVWSSYPSWAQFSWLYFFSVLALMRAMLLVRFGIAGWEMWVVGALVLIGVAAFIRYWVSYALTSTRVVVMNGYTGSEVEAIKLEDIQGLEVKQGPVAAWFDIGTLQIQGPDDRVVRLRGIKDPDAVQARIEAKQPASRTSP